MNSINMKVKDLRRIVNNLSTEYDDIPVVIPVISEEDSDNILAFRIVRTARIIHENGEISDGNALIFNTSTGPDIATQINNRKSDVICKKLLF